MRLTRFATAEDLVQAHRSLDTSGYNFVSLVDLRRALPLPRGEFDRLLLEARRRGLLSLAAAEGRFRLGQAELDAAVREGDELLLYAMRRGG